MINKELDCALTVCLPLRSVLFDTDCVNPGLRGIALQYDNLLAYTERIRSDYFEGELTWEETY